MMSAYGVDTLAPGLSLRRMWILWQRLPPGTRLRADVEDVWSQESYLLAGVIDWLAHLDYVTRQVWSKKRIEPPKPMERPADAAAKRGDGPPTKTLPKQASPWRSLLRRLNAGEVTRRGR